MQYLRKRQISHECTDGCGNVTWILTNLFFILLTCMIQLNQITFMCLIPGSCGLQKIVISNSEYFISSTAVTGILGTPV